MERPKDKLREYAQKSMEEFTAKLDQHWLATVPDSYKGHSVREIRGENDDDFGWNGSLDEGDVIRLERYLEEPTKFLILRGTAGTGKTTLGATIGRALVRRKQLGGKFVNSVAMLNDFSFREEHDSPVKHFASFGVLLIDDLGAVNESLTPHQQKSLWSLIEERWSKNDKYTIITTNMALIDSKEGVGLSSWIGESGWDRISDDLTRVQMSGDSFRA